MNNTPLIPQTSFAAPRGYVAVGMRDSFTDPTRTIYHVRVGSAMAALEDAQRALYLARRCRIGTRACGAFSDKTARMMRADIRRYAQMAVGHGLRALVALRAGYLC